MSLKHSLNWLWINILYICLPFLAIISLCTRTVIPLSWTLRSSRQDLPVGTFPTRTFLRMAAAQEWVSLSSSSHSLSDSVCQGPIKQKMNKTLAPFKILVGVRRTRKTAKWCLQCHSNGGHKYSGRVSGQVWVGSYWLHKARSAESVSPRWEAVLPGPGANVSSFEVSAVCRWVGAGEGDGVAEMPMVYSLWLRTDFGCGRTDFRCGKARPLLSSPVLLGQSSQSSAGEDGSGCSTLCSWPWTWRLSPGGWADATGDSGPSSWSYTDCTLKELKQDVQCVPVRSLPSLAVSAAGHAHPPTSPAASRGLWKIVPTGED